MEDPSKYALKRITWLPGAVVVDEEQFGYSQSTKIETLQEAREFLQTLPGLISQQITCLDAQSGAIEASNTPYKALAALRIRRRSDVEETWHMTYDLSRLPPSSLYPQHYVALSGFDTYSTDQLYLRRGRVVTVLASLGEWLVGESRGKRGLFPRTKVMELHEVQAAAANDNAAALFELGVRLHFAYGIEQDFRAGVKCFLKAANLGLARAQHNLGWCLLHADGVEQDQAEAIRWYLRAAASGHAGGEFSLGTCYADGKGVERDVKQAVYWMRRSADRGYPRAQQQMGDFCAEGTGVAVDVIEAYRWYRLSAEQDHCGSQCSLGYFYENGHGCQVDMKEAVRWYLLAAEQGESTALYNIGQCYNYGRGVDCDKMEAAWWHCAAAAAGDLDSPTALKALFDDLEIQRLP